MSLPLLLIGFAASFRFSVRERTLPNEAGLATVFKVTRKKGTCNLGFGLGLENGVCEGDAIVVLDRNRGVVGGGRVRNAAERHAAVAVDPDLHVQPDFLVDTRRDLRCSCPG